MSPTETKQSPSRLKIEALQVALSRINELKPLHAGAGKQVVTAEEEIAFVAQNGMQQRCGWIIEDMIKLLRIEMARGG